MDTSPANLSALLTRTRLRSEAEAADLLKRWQAEAGAAADTGAAFVKWLVAGQQITPYQGDRLLRGQVDHYFFGEYQVLDRLGAGRMAGVFKAAHRLGQVVAIKVLPPNKAKDAVALARFEREARLAMPLKHPNVVRTFQAGIDDKLHYLVMEYIEGETLEDVLKRRTRLPAYEAVRLVHQALLGLQHLLKQGMVHRDLKPANLMLTPGRVAGEPDSTLEATLKILDIGVGRALFEEATPVAGAGQDLTNQGDLLGGPDYMAPEQARDAHTSDIRADIYALGCVLYHCLTGQPPFPGNNIVVKLQAHAQQAPKPLTAFDPKLPQQLQAILDCMLAKTAAQRYSTPAKTAQALEVFLADMDATTPAAAMPVPPELPMRADGTRPSAVKRVPQGMPARAGKPKQETAAARLQREKMQQFEAWLEEQDRKPGIGMKLYLAAAALLAVAMVFWGVLEFRARRDRAVSLGSPTTAGTPGGPQEVVKPAAEDWAKTVAALPADKQVAAVAARLKELNPGFDGVVKRIQPTAQDAGAEERALEERIVAGLEFSSDNVTDLTPLKALSGLRRLRCAGSAIGKGKLADLTPLQGMGLTVLDCSSTRVADLAPLKGMPLVFLDIGGTQVRDLTPLQDIPLLSLSCPGTQITDLGPLQDMPLTVLDAAGLRVADLSPLKGMPLQNLWCEVQPQRDAELLKTIIGLKEVNGKPLAEIVKQADAQQKPFEDWLKAVAKQPADQQVESVMAELKKRNPGFDGKEKHTAEGPTVVALQLVSDDLTDIAPLRALAGLKRLTCSGSLPGKGKLANLKPLHGLKLTALDVRWSRVSDLTPLADMPLTDLNLAGNVGVVDLTPLKALPLTQLRLEGNLRVTDLTPLKGRPLTALNVAETQIADLAPLTGMKLTELSVHGTPVQDLALLKGMPLRSVTCDFVAARDTELLRGLKSLERINNKKAKEFWDEIDARQRAFDAYVARVKDLPAAEQVQAVADKLKEHNPGFDGKVESKIENGTLRDLTFISDQVLDLSPLRALPSLRRLSAAGSEPGKSKLADLSPLKGLTLISLDLSHTAVSDLKPLIGHPLRSLNLAGTPVVDLAPLARLPLAELDITGTQVADLAPLKSLPLTELRCDGPNEADLTMLRSIASLKTLNGKPLEKATAVVVAPREKEKSKGPKPTFSFAGVVVKVPQGSEEKAIKVKTTQPVVTVNYHHAYYFDVHRRAILFPPPFRKVRDLLNHTQHHSYWMAYHRSFLYDIRERDQTFDLVPEDDIKVRVSMPPQPFDEKGNPRKYTAQEMKELKGEDPRVPGYKSSLEFVQVGQTVVVYLGTGKVITQPAVEGEPVKKIVDPRPRFVMLLVVVP